MTLIQDRKGTPLENFQRTSRPIRRQDFWLSTNEKPGFEGRFLSFVESEAIQSNANSPLECQCPNSTASSHVVANRSLPFIKGSGWLAGPWDEFPSPDISQSSVTQSSGSRVAVQWYSISRVSFDFNYFPVTFEWHSSDSSVAVEWQSIGRVCFKSNYIPVTFQWHLSDSPVAVQWQLSGNLLVVSF